MWKIREDAETKLKRRLHVHLSLHAPRRTEVVAIIQGRMWKWTRTSYRDQRGSGAVIVLLFFRFGGSRTSSRHRLRIYRSDSENYMYTFPRIKKIKASANGPMIQIGLGTKSPGPWSVESAISWIKRCHLRDRGCCYNYNNFSTHPRICSKTYS